VASALAKRVTSVVVPAASSARAHPAGVAPLGVQRERVGVRAQRCSRRRRRGVAGVRQRLPGVPADEAGLGERRARALVAEADGDQRRRAARQRERGVTGPARGRVELRVGDEAAADAKQTSRAAAPLTTSRGRSTPASTSAFAFGSRSTNALAAASGAPRERAPVKAASRSCAGAPAARATSAVGARAIALAGTSAAR
jgi:hypothetical protein